MRPQRNDDDLSPDLIAEDYILRQEAFKKQNRYHSHTEKPHPILEVTDDLIKDILAGKLGTGYQRKTRLKRAGYNYETVKWKLSRLEAETRDKQ